jgi:hypothetical protein
MSKTASRGIYSCLKKLNWNDETFESLEGQLGNGCYFVVCHRGKHVLFSKYYHLRGTFALAESLTRFAGLGGFDCSQLVRGAVGKLLRLFDVGLNLDM